MRQYLKAWAAVLGAVLVALYSALGGDEGIDAGEGILIIIAAASAFEVWLVSNDVPGARYAKSITAAVLAVAGALTAYLTAGISSSEWVDLVILGLTAAGVLAVPKLPSRTVALRPRVQ